MVGVALDDLNADRALQSFFDRLRDYSERPALYWRGETQTYAKILSAAASWEKKFEVLGIQRGTVVAYIADYWPEAVALTLALINVGAIAVPFSETAAREAPKLTGIAEAEIILYLSPDAEPRVESLTPTRAHPLVEEFRSRQRPGCIVFSSGSTGEPKGILHDFGKLLTKFEKPRPTYRTLLFLLIDHLGGLNTLLSVLSNGGLAVTAERRTPEEVCRSIEAARVELLPTTPAFLTLLTTSHTAQEFDLSSLQVISYGTDAMPDQTLKATARTFPDVKLQQTYGLSEVGVLRSKSKSSDSLMVRVGGDGFETKIVDGVLWVRSQSAMVGYLNAPNPFDAEGWLNTGDLVEIDGEHLRILGRESELINVGGQKVFPVEVENVLMQAANILDATVYSESHPVMGRIVAARVTTATPEDALSLRRRLRQFCLERLAPFKVPARITATTDSQHSDRFKKIRS